MEKKIGVCIVGCGFMGGIHAKYLSQVNDVSLFFASRDINKARDFCRRFNGDGFFGNYEEAAKDGFVDALLICTPNNEHIDGIKLAAKYRKHVFVEKPLAVSLDEADEAIAISKKAGIILMVGENYRFMPAAKRVKELIENRAIGNLKFCISKCFGRVKPSGWRLLQKSTGGGVLIDVGIHFVDILRNIGGEAEKVFALKPEQTYTDMEGEDSVSVLMKLNKCIGQINYSCASYGPRIQFTSFIGTEGRILMENAGLFVLLDGMKKGFFLTGLRDGNGFKAMHKEFLDSIRENRQPLSDSLEGRKNLRIVMAAYESLKKGVCVGLRT